MNCWEDRWLDYYKILEVDRNASFSQIKKKYHKLMRKYHPDNSNEKDTIEMVQLINEAYSVLSNSEKKKIYDLEYDKKLHSTMYTASSQTAEEDMKQYTKEEQKFAKAVALKSIVEKELEKANIVIDAKNEIIYSAYDEEIDKFDYYKNVKEFVTMANAYNKELYDLCELCYKYELFSEIETINEVLLFLEDHIRNIPLSPREARRFMEEERRKENILSMGEEKKEEIEETIQDIEALFQSIYLKQVSHIEYKQLSKKVLIKAEEVLSSGQQLILLLTKNDLENKELERVLSKLGALVKIWPEDYVAAGEIGKYIFTNVSTKTNLDAIFKQYEEYAKKVQKIIGVIKRHPTNHHVELLYNHTKELSKEMRKKLQEALQQNQTEQQIQSIIEKAFLLSKEAEEIYTKAEEQSKEADKVYNTKEKHAYNDKEIQILLKEAVHQFDKGKSLELLKEGYYLRIFEEINLLKNDWIKQNQILKANIQNVNQYDEEIERMMYIIHEIVGDYKSIMNMDENTLEIEGMNFSSWDFFIAWVVFSVIETFASSLLDFKESLPFFIITTGAILSAVNHQRKELINAYEKKRKVYSKRYNDLKEGKVL